MSQSNKKTGHGADMDEINNLPCNVIDNILSKLPIRDLVRTSILSRKWRYMWTCVSTLVFDQSFWYKFCNKYGHVYGSNIADQIISEALLLHNGPVHKFTLHIPHVTFQMAASV
jgi:hypothetical protein